MFPNLKKKEAIFPHPSDSSGNSKIDGVYFYFDSGGDVSTWCTDYEETFRVKNNMSEGFNIAITSAEVINWLEDYQLHGFIKMNRFHKTPIYYKKLEHTK